MSQLARWQMRLYGHVSRADHYHSDSTLRLELRDIGMHVKLVCTFVRIACILDLIESWTCHLTKAVSTITTLSVLPGAG
jgi:hypothetical protein